MNICGDYHTHTCFSFDAARENNSPCDVAEAALAAGLCEVALTDHLEVNSEVEGLYPRLDIEARQDACLEAKQRYKGKISVLVGIELGQMTQYPQLAREYLDRYKFDFVIGSLHNIAHEADFALIDYSGFSRDDYTELWRRYLDELYELTCFGCFDTVAHITYPLRYYERAGFYLDIAEYGEQLDRVLGAIASRGMALEVNTSGYRQGMGRPLPDADIIKRFRALGGKGLTVGSDAHRCGDVGADFDRASRLLSEI